MDRTGESILIARCRFVYEAGRAAAEAAEAPIIPPPWEDRDEVFKAHLAVAVEKQCTGPIPQPSPEENAASHERWMKSYREMGWVYGPEYDPENRVHPDLICYEDLDQREKNKDAIFAALCVIARQYI
jgi:hypothetical protein